MYWLIPRLREFSQRYPGISVQVHTVDGDIDPASPADVFIRREVSELCGLPSRVLMSERSLLVSSPLFQPNMTTSASKRAAWLTKVPRIGARSRPDLWPSWGKFHGISENATEPTLEFENTILAIQAAAQGLGVCVVPEVFIASMLSSGALHPLHPLPVTTGSYSYAIGRERDSARVNRFISWLSALPAETLTLG